MIGVSFFRMGFYVTSNEFKSILKACLK